MTPAALIEEVPRDSSSGHPLAVGVNLPQGDPSLLCFDGEVMRAEPCLAQTDLQNAEAVRGKLAMVWRDPPELVNGRTPFTTKVSRVQSAGAKGCIIVNTDEEVVDVEVEVDLPCVLLAAGDAARLQDGAVLHIHGNKAMMHRASPAVPAATLPALSNIPSCMSSDISAALPVCNRNATTAHAAAPLDREQQKPLRLLLSVASGVDREGGAQSDSQEYRLEVETSIIAPESSAATLPPSMADELDIADVSMAWA